MGDAGSAYMVDCTDSSNCTQQSRLMAVDDAVGHRCMLLDVVCCLMLLDIVVCCWVPLDTVACWMSFDIIGYHLKPSIGFCWMSLDVSCYWATWMCLGCYWSLTDIRCQSGICWMPLAVALWHALYTVAYHWVVLGFIGCASPWLYTRLALKIPHLQIYCHECLDHCTAQCCQCHRNNAWPEKRWYTAIKRACRYHCQLLPNKRWTSA